VSSLSEEDINAPPLKAPALDEVVAMDLAAASILVTVEEGKDPPQGTIKTSPVVVVVHDERSLLDRGPDAGADFCCIP